MPLPNILAIRFLSKILNHEFLVHKNLFIVALTENSTLPMGRQFMLNLLVRSLIADGGIEEAIMNAISDVKVGMDSRKEEPIITDMASTPILQLIQQLLNNLTIQQLTYFKQVKIIVKSNTWASH